MYIIKKNPSIGNIDYLQNQIDQLELELGVPEVTVPG